MADGRQLDGGWRVVDVELQIGGDDEPKRVQFLSFCSVFFSCKKKDWTLGVIYALKESDGLDLLKGTCLWRHKGTEVPPDKKNQI